MAREIKARGAEEKSPLLPCTPAPSMIFSPSKWLGLSIGLTALALIGASDFFLLPVARANFPSWLTFLILCWLIASVPLVIWLGYRCYALARARYVVTRNALVVQWGFRRELIPMGLLGEVRAGTEAEGDSGLALRPRHPLERLESHRGAARDDGGLAEELAAGDETGVQLLRKILQSAVHLVLL